MDSWLVHLELGLESGGQKRHQSEARGKKKVQVLNNKD